MAWLFPSLHGYRRADLRGDLLAALSVWAVLIPEALAYATIAGVPPVVGLYAAPPALVLYAALGSSRLLVAGPMSATAALSAATIADVATGGQDVFLTLTIALALATGVAALLAGALRLGFVASFISEPVVKGVIVGLAITIIVRQLPHLLGVEAVSGDVIEQFDHLLPELDATDGATVAVGLVSLAVLLALRRWWRAAPGALVVVALGVVMVRVLGLDGDVEVVGPISGGLPSPGLPDAGAADYEALVPGALGIMLVAFAEGLGAARAYARRGDPEVDPNRELLGVGAANVGSSLFGGFVVNGSLSKTAVNVGAGARTQLAGLVVAGLTVLTLLLLTGLFEDLPLATLAAVVIVAVVDLVDVPSLAGYYRAFAGRSATPFSLAARPDFIAAIAALVGVLVFGILAGLFIGIGVSLLLLIYRASRPHIARLGRAPGSDQYTDVHRHPENVLPEGVVVLRVESPLFFANADVVRSAARAAAREEGVHAVVIDAEAVPTIDITAAHMLHELHDELAAEGVRFVLARDVGQVRDVLLRTAGDQDPAITSVFATVAKAVRAVGPEDDPG
ncbi:MAG: SulP family inorganic anion transporter [Solirubrobacteraceae bacterium]